MSATRSYCCLVYNDGTARFIRVIAREMADEIEFCGTKFRVTPERTLGGWYVYKEVA